MAIILKDKSKERDRESIKARDFSWEWWNFFGISSKQVLHFMLMYNNPENLEWKYITLATSVEKFNNE